jgi:hypothetical protein
MEFLVQKDTRIAIDLKKLATIEGIAMFREMCAWLEAQGSHRNSASSAFSGPPAG